MADGTWSGVYLYNGAGQLASVDNATLASASEPASFISAMAYNAAGQMTAITYGNGAVTSYGYDDKGGWMKLAQTAQSATTLMDFLCAELSITG